MKTEGILKTISILKEVSPYIETNLALQDQIDLAIQLNKLYKKGSIAIQTLAGEPKMINGVSYWLADFSSIQKAHEEFTAEDANSIQTSTSQSPQESAIVISENNYSPSLGNDLKQNELNKPQKNATSLIILNGSGISGKAIDVARFFEARGLKVTEIGNAYSSDYEYTEILNWGVSGKIMRDLTKDLQIEPTRIVRYREDKAENKVIVIVGRDWDVIAK